MSGFPVTVTFSVFVRTAKDAVDTLKQPVFKVAVISACCNNLMNCITVLQPATFWYSIHFSTVLTKHA